DETINPLIKSLEFDSRKVTPGSLFFALPGTHVHGNTFIENAVNAGASAVIYQDELPKGAYTIAINNKTPLLKVPNTRFIMAPIAARFYDNPSEQLKIIGITGTEGKSTTVYFVWQLLQLMGKKSGFFSTVHHSFGEEAINNPEHLTTPEAPIVQAQLRQMLDNGCEYAVIEASSHGLSKKTNRLGNVAFDAVAMMNVTHEHLEFHGTHEQYKYDKANLFRALDVFSHSKKTPNTTDDSKCTVPAFGVVNLEDASAKYFAESTKYPVYGFTTNGEAGASSTGLSEQAATTFEKANIQSSWEGSNILSEKNGIYFTFSGPSAIGTNQNDLPIVQTLHLNLSGAFNVYNTMASILLVSGILGINTAEVIAKTPELIPVKGRMSRIDQGQSFQVLVDYAHTPSSFRTIFPPLRKQLKNKGKLMCLFGSGGERDVKKRPEQGKIAAEFCDIVFLTDEDPRNEKPMAILEDIAAGCESSEASNARKNTIRQSTPIKRDKTLFLIPSRQGAIKKAFEIAKNNDIVLLLGKAHENSIMYKDFTMPYDEISQAKSALKELGYTK
ncbi:MAG TPA: UDP-N-acetylmuramoyl-L-alanyl-D-glutamate--2,6-diaminopimelate ligase, partial [Treponemataceae bacterium]|nr:UDP-N-acetylmuramoyl-L-alanyl-D-glutamate--2,6-diaminopimelate ligase [Treponemataceae bacterium]